MQEVDWVITGGVVLTLEEKDRRIEGGALAIDGDTIKGLGKAEELRKQFIGRRVIEAKDSIIMPGLVNCHTHAAMTCFRGMADDMELTTWLNDYIFPAEAKHVDARLAYWGSLLACAEMIKSGTTTFCDMYIFEDETAKAAKEAGIRCRLGEGLLGFPHPNASTPAAGLVNARNLIEKWQGDPLVSVMVGPHSLYTCPPPLLIAARELADAYGLPYGLHLLENREEQRQLEKSLGKKPLTFLQGIGYLTERFLAYHGVYMDDEDIGLFAKEGSRVIHDPESNMKLASGVAPVPAMLKAGVTVGLGTDGCASNNNLDMFGEMATVAKLHKLQSLDPTVMPARTVLRMATCEGAKALGLGEVTGTLAAGKKADVIILGLNKPHLTPLYNEYSHLVYAASGADVDTVFINGQLVMQNRRLLTIDEGEVMTQVRNIAGEIKRNLPPGGSL